MAKLEDVGLPFSSYKLRAAHVTLFTQVVFVLIDMLQFTITNVILICKIWSRTSHL